MNKSLYSLILMDDVVNEIDRLALRMNMNRSGLVNQILADYVSLMTPEKRISEIYKRIAEIMADSRELIPAISQRNSAISMKSSLDYKYRPTIRYEVQLYREPAEYIGELNVILRTQSEALLNVLGEFFRTLKYLEDKYISSQLGNIRYELYDGHFVRSIAIPRTRNYSEEDIGNAICKYVEMLDNLMKEYTAGCSVELLEKHYVAYLNSGVGLI